MKNKRMEFWVFLLTTAAMGVYLLWRVLCTQPLGDPWYVVALGVVLTLCEVDAALGLLQTLWQKRKLEALELPELPEGWFPAVDVLVAVQDEPQDLLLKTVNACTHLQYPDPSLVHIYVCCDEPRPEIAALCTKIGVTLLEHRGNTQGKAGNLNHGLLQSASPLVVALDADTLPQSDFLLRTVPYFFLPKLQKDPQGRWGERKPEEGEQAVKIGLVQAPQNFYNPELFQHSLFVEKTVADPQAFFSKEVNVLRNQLNASCRTGSTAVLSRQALQDIGGFPCDALTEDFEAGILVQTHGYTRLVTGEALASGQTPVTVKSLLAQRVRWARGVIQSIKNTHAAVNGRLPLSARLSYLGLFSYWWSFARRLVFLLTPILFGLLGWRSVHADFWPILLFWVPAHLLASMALRFLDSDPRTRRWPQILDTAMMPYLILPVALETFGLTRPHSTALLKSHRPQSPVPQDRSFRYALPHLLLMGLTLAALFHVLQGQYGMALLSRGPILFWLVYNLLHSAFGVFFMLSRPQHRSSERFAATEELTVSQENRTLRGLTSDVSEGGLSFVLDRPAYLSPDAPLRLQVKTPRYEAAFTGLLTYVKQAGSQWRYSVRLHEIDLPNRRQYLQIVHDRPRPLPAKMDSWVNVADDLIANMALRMEKPTWDKRAFPRIQLDRPMASAEGLSGTLLNFNYHNALMDLGSAPPPKRLTLPLSQGLSLLLSSPQPGPGGTLYAVQNWQELAYSEAFAALLNQWLQENEENHAEQLRLESIGGMPR